MTRLMACTGCGQLVAPGPKCAACRRAAAQIYDSARPAHHAWYQTPEWRRLSSEVRASATRCHWCLKPTRRLLADHVDPVGPETTWEQFLDRSRLRPSCFGCNTRRGRNAKLPDLPIPEPVRTRARREAARLLGATSSAGWPSGSGQASPTGGADG